MNYKLKESYEGSEVSENTQMPIYGISFNPLEKVFIVEEYSEIEELLSGDFKLISSSGEVESLIKEDSLDCISPVIITERTKYAYYGETFITSEYGVGSAAQSILEKTEERNWVSLDNLNNLILSTTDPEKVAEYTQQRNLLAEGLIELGDLKKNGIPVRYNF